MKKITLILSLMFVLFLFGCGKEDYSDQLGFKLISLYSENFIPIPEYDIMTIYINENNECFVNIGLEKPKKMEGYELSETYLKYILSDFTEDYEQSLITLFLVHDSLSLYQLKKTMNKFDSLEVICENFIDNFDTTKNESKYYIKPITTIDLSDNDNVKNKIVRERRAASFPISFYLPKLTAYQKQVYFRNGLSMKYDTTNYDIDYHISINNDMNDQKRTIHNAKKIFSKHISIDTIQNNTGIISSIGIPYPVEFKLYKTMFDTLDSNHFIKIKNKTLKYRTNNHKYQLPFNIDNAIIKTDFNKLKIDSIEKRWNNLYDDDYNYLLKQNNNFKNDFKLYKISNSDYGYTNLLKECNKYDNRPLWTFAYDIKYLFVSKKLKYSDLVYFTKHFKYTLFLNIRFYD